MSLKGKDQKNKPPSPHSLLRKGGFKKCNPCIPQKFQVDPLVKFPLVGVGGLLGSLPSFIAHIIVDRDYLYYGVSL